MREFSNFTEFTFFGGGSMTPLDSTNPENSYKAETSVFNVARLLMHPRIKVFQFP